MAVGRPSYRVVWLEIAERQYLDLPDTARDGLDLILSQLEHDPTGLPGVAYDEPSDQWSVPFGDLDLVLYAVVRDRATVVVLRIVHVQT